MPATDSTGTKRNWWRPFPRLVLFAHRRSELQFGLTFECCNLPSSFEVCVGWERARYELGSGDRRRTAESGDRIGPSGHALQKISRQPGRQLSRSSNDPPPPKMLTSTLDTDLYKLTMQQAVLEVGPSPHFQSPSRAELRIVDAALPGCVGRVQVHQQGGHQVHQDHVQQGPRCAPGSVRAYASWFSRRGWGLTFSRLSAASPSRDPPVRGRGKLAPDAMPVLQACLHPIPGPVQVQPGRSGQD